MPIKCYFGDYTSHSHEKAMLDSFLSQLEPIYGGEHQPWIYVAFNAMWQGREVDLVCFTQNSISVCDLKGYSGKLIQAAENGEWIIKTDTGEDVVVKGGGQINPFVQIRKNKYAIKGCIEDMGLFQGECLDHISGCIVFDELSTCNANFSQGVMNWFRITDLPYSADTINSLHSNSINLTEPEVIELLTTLNLTAYSDQAKMPLRNKVYSPFPKNQLEKPAGANHDFSQTSQVLKNLTSNANIYKKPSQVDHNQPSRFNMVQLPLAIIIVLCAALSYTTVKIAENGDGVCQVRGISLLMATWSNSDICITDD